MVLFLSSGLSKINTSKMKKLNRLQLTFVSTRIPYPPDKDGYTENIFHIIKGLKENYPISVNFIVFRKQNNDTFEKAFEKHVDKLSFKPHISRYLFPLIHLLYKKINVSHSVFFCDFNSGYYQSIFKCKNKILYSADSPTFYYSNREGLKSRLFYFKYIIEESFLYPKFKNVIFVSDLDMQYSKNRTRGRGIQVPIGYNMERVRIYEYKEFDLIFSGNFSYSPNYEAAEHFLQLIYKELRKLYPDIKICFVGRDPSPKMKYFAKMNPKNVIVTGEVESVEEFLGRAKIYCSPLLSGSGMKNKILQAMAAQLPIVATEESMSGFSGFNSKSVLVEQNIKSLLPSLKIMLSKNNEELENLGRVNQAYFKVNYSWKAVLKKHYEQILNLK